MKKYTTGELIADAVSHGVGVLFSITGLIVIILKANTFIGYFSGIIYGVCLVFLYLSSTLFHSFPMSFTRTRAVFQRFDHSAIFLLIVGTYTPLILYALPLKKAIIFLSLMWLLTIVGIVFKAIWIKRFKAIHLIIYILMGWSVVFVWDDILLFVDQGLWLLVAGGLAYTLGVVFYLWRFRYHHFIWHLFVLAGSAFHFFLVYQII